MAIKEKIEQLRAARDKANEVIKEADQKLKTAKLSISPQTLKNLIKKLEDARNSSDIKAIEAAIAEAKKVTSLSQYSTNTSSKKINDVVNSLIIDPLLKANNETYQQHVTKGDEFYNKRYFARALEEYKSANKINSGNELTTKIKEIEQYLSEKTVYCILSDYPNKGDRYEGKIKNGKPHGEGIIFYSNGDRYEGNFVDGYAPKGRFHFVGSGNSQEGYFDEKRKWIIERINYKNGNWAQGTFDEKQKLNGFGVMYVAEYKRTDTGEYEHGLRIGEGKMVWKAGHWYCGEWNNKGRNGKGEERYPNEDCKKGIFVDDKFKSGKYTHKDGNYYDGTFDENSKLHGEGTYYDAAKKRQYVGTFEHGKCIGKGKIIYLKNGMTEDGEWDDYGVFKGKRTLSDGSIEAINSY